MLTTSIVSCAVPPGQLNNRGGAGAEDKEDNKGCGEDIIPISKGRQLPSQNQGDHSECLD